MKIEEEKFEQEEHYHSALGLLKRLWVQITSVVIFLILVLILAIILLRFKPIVIHKPTIHIVELPEFTEALEASTNYEIFDMRGEQAYVGGHIPGAQFTVSDTCHVYSVTVCNVGACDFSKDYFFYSNKGEEYHEVTRAVEQSAFLGCWGEVWMLDGGFEAWKKAGQEIEK